MAAQWLFCNALVAFLILFIAPHLSKSDDGSIPLPTFSFSWMDDKDEYYIGDIATIRVKVLGDYNAEEYKYPFNPDLSVNDTMGNSSFIAEVHSDFGTDMNNWQIVFKPITVGLFYVLIHDEHFRVNDSSMHFHVSPAEAYVAPRFSFEWLNNKMDFRAGEIATIRVIVYENFNTKTYKHPFNPKITLSDDRGQNEKTGNSSYITGVIPTLGTDTNKWQLHFIPIMIGYFNVFIHQDNPRVFDASMHFTVTPGGIYLPGGVVSWRGQVNNFLAGTKAAVLILPKDSFGNNVTIRSDGPKIYNFVVYATHENGEEARIVDIAYRGWNGFEPLGYLSIDFTTVTSGSLLLHIKDKEKHLINTPLPFTVEAGAFDLSSSVPHWNTETKSYQLFSIMETFISQKDKHGNLVPGNYSFEFDVVDSETFLSLPISDLQQEEVSPGIQLFSFQILEPGGFFLVITDKTKNFRVRNMPYEFSVYIGYCDGVKSVVNGSGLNNSIAGEVSKFSILLRDAYQYPSPIESHSLFVQISLPSKGLYIERSISPLNSLNGTQPTGKLNFDAFDPKGINSVPSVNSQNNISAESWKTWNSEFEVVYIPEKSGLYEIRIFCGNIQLNNGNPFTKFVSAGEVNTSLSSILKYEPKVSNMVLHGVDLQLLDSFSNPVLLHESRLSKLTLEAVSLNKALFQVFLFIDNKDGTYTGFYMPMILGTFEICASFDGKRFSRCPFEVTTYNREYFPVANGVEVFVFEDQSSAFNALENDYFSGGKAKVVEYQRPGHGALVEYGDMLRYSPFKGFFGEDSFAYTMSDAKGNNASSHVYLHVHCIPPEFVSFPTRLVADEDSFSPTFGGFPDFEITYSDPTDNVSIVFSAQHGSVFLYPLHMQFFDPMWTELSVTKMEGKSRDLIITGRLEVMNFALKSIKYIGDGNFSGINEKWDYSATDTLRVSTINQFGRTDLDIPVIVNPVNDPPVINAPKFIMLGNMAEEDEGFLLFDRKRDNFSFSIDDPDLLHFPGNKSHFRVMFSVEVSSGYFSAILPAKLISSTELKLKNSRQWQPLQTFIEISKRFTVKARAIRFRGTIDDCNTLLQQILYYGDEDGGVLKLIVNDMGWYGCYPDCTRNMSMPLTSEATIILLTKMPVDSVVAHSLVSMIVIESVLLSSLAVLLLFFSCKCVFFLVHKKITKQVQSQLYQLQSSHGHMSSTDSSENMAAQPSSLSKTLQKGSGLG